MREIVKKVILILLMLIVLTTISTISLADTSMSFKATLSPTSKTLKPGEEIEISVNVSDIDMGEYGINALEGTLKYDKEIFETVKSSNIQSKNNWTVTYNDENSTKNGKFLAANLSSGVKENTTILTVTLKVKTTLNQSKTTLIYFEDITSNNGTDLVNPGTKTVNVTINVENNQEEPIIEPEPEETFNEEDTDKQTYSFQELSDEEESYISSEDNINIAQAGEDIPYTGKSEVIGVAIIVTIIIAVYLWKRNSYYKGI